jgi:hypothetical protein
MKIKARVIGKGGNAETVHREWLKVGGAIPVKHQRRRDVYEGHEGTVIGDRVRILGERMKLKAPQSNVLMIRFAHIDESEYDLAPLRRLTGGGDCSVLTEDSFAPQTVCSCGRWRKRELLDDVTFQDSLEVVDYCGQSLCTFVSPRMAEAIGAFPGVALTAVGDGRVYRLESDRHLGPSILARDAPCPECGETSDRVRNIMVYDKPVGPISGMYCLGGHHEVLVFAPDLLDALTGQEWNVSYPLQAHLPVFLDEIPWDIGWECPELLYATTTFEAFYAVPGLTPIPPGDSEVLLLGGARIEADLAALEAYRITPEEAAARATDEFADNPAVGQRLLALGAETSDVGHAVMNKTGQEAILKLADTLLNEFEARHRA